MDDGLIWLMVRGAVADPVLWVFAAVVGWDHRRPARSTAVMLAGAGAIWGFVRVAVYGALGETLGAGNAALMVSICFVIMLGAGLLVREVRWYFAR